MNYAKTWSDLWIWLYHQHDQYIMTIHAHDWRAASILYCMGTLWQTWFPMAVVHWPSHRPSLVQTGHVIEIILALVVAPDRDLLPVQFLCIISYVNSAEVNFLRSLQVCLYSETCLERPLPWETTCFKKDHIFLAQGSTFQYNWTCHQLRPPVLRDHISMSEVEVFQDMFYCMQKLTSDCCGFFTTCCFTGFTPLAIARLCRENLLLRRPLSPCGSVPLYL